MVIFHAFVVCWLLFKINLFQKILPETLSVDWFGSWSGPTFCWSWSGSQLIAKVISRWQKLLLTMKEFPTFFHHFRKVKFYHIGYGWWWQECRITLFFPTILTSPQTEINTLLGRVVFPVVHIESAQISVFLCVLVTAKIFSLPVFTYSDKTRIN